MKSHQEREWDAMQPTNRKSAQGQLEDMVHTLREEILQGTHKSGEYLPSEKTLAARFGIGNLTVRRGLEQLVDERLIEKIPRVGNRVVSPAEAGIVTLQFAYHGSLVREAVIERLLADFHQIHPHIRVQTFNIASHNYYPMVRELIDRDAIDVFTINYNNYREMDQHGGLGLLEPLEPNPYLYPFLFDAFKHGGKVLVQPLIFSPLVLCYNRAHFLELGLGEPDSSWSWEYLLDVADRLAAGRDRLGFFCHIASINRWVVFLIQNGAILERGPSGRLEPPDERLLQTLRMMRELVKHMNKSPVKLSGIGMLAEELFFEGRASMIMTTYYNLNHALRDQIPYELATLPALENPLTTLHTIGLSVVKESKVKESAKLLIDYLTSERAQLQIRRHTLSIPAHKIAAEWQGSEGGYRPSRFELYRDIIPNMRLYSALNASDDELNGIYRAVRLYMAGAEEEEAMLERLTNIFSTRDQSGLFEQPL